MPRHAHTRGMTLIDTLVGVALIVVVFVGVSATFKLAVNVVTNNKARAGAIALANQRMEYIHSLPYSSVGVVGGVPAGTIPQLETIALNGVTFKRDTLVEYVDDPADGLAGSDANSIPEDYRLARVDVSWGSQRGTRHITLVSRISPTYGMESSVPGGTLSISIMNAASQPLSGAQVVISNAGTSPAVNINTASNASGTVTVLGAPSASNYNVTVTQAGYSTAQTYAIAGQNASPNPANPTVTNGHTTNVTLAIDLLATKIINTWSPMQVSTWTDLFSNGTKIASSTNIVVSGGAAMLSGSAPYPLYGEVKSVALGTSSISHWRTLHVTDSHPSNTNIVYHVYDGTGNTLIPDEQLPNNGVGFASGTIDLSGISTSTYPFIRLDAVYTSDGSATPSLDAWSADYDIGPAPLPNVAFNLQGAKTIGLDASLNPIYKYTTNLSSGGSASLTLSNMEWDAYTISATGATYDISSACNPQPENLAPGGTQTTNVYFLPHTTNSLLVDVRASATGLLIPGATVALGRANSTTTVSTDACGQAFFSGLTSANDYTLSVAAAGFITGFMNNVSASGRSRESISLDN